MSGAAVLAAGSLPSAAAEAVQPKQCPCVAAGSYCQFDGSSCPFAGNCHGSATPCDCTDCGEDPFGKIDPACVACDQPSPAPAIAPWEGPYPFDLWYDPPGSAEYARRKPLWYDTLLTRAGESFTSTDAEGQPATVQVGMGRHGAIHLFADPSFQQGFDDKVRAWSGRELAGLKTGTVDRCGWPNASAAEAPDARQYTRRTVPLLEDFSGGMRNDTWSVALAKGCCEFDDAQRDANPYHRNLNIVRDVVGGVEKNVLALTAWNEDDPSSCPGPSCVKNVRSSGTVSTADVFASGRYAALR
jgi:hypothetical protein